VNIVSPTAAANEVSTDTFEKNLAAMCRDVRDPRGGFCGPGSVSWRMDGEIALHAAGPRALLMQFAHPMVAQGIVDHSNFRTDLLGRTLRTFGAVYGLIFGTRDEAVAAARQIHRVHQRVRGTLAHTSGIHRAGTPYAGNDPALLAWVWATLIDSAFYGYEQFVAPLEANDRDRWYQECRTLSGFFGLPPETFPDTHHAFVRWMDRRIASDEIAVGPPARELTEVFISGRTGPPGLGAMFAVLASGTLHPRLRDAFGLPWDLRTRISYSSLRSAIRAARVLPRPLRSIPVATRARWRCRAMQ
jgi:uncharacterized protein (DUF2236 family)